VGVVVVVEAVVQDQGGQTVFVGGGAGGEVAAEAVAEQVVLPDYG
jgi:homoserine dehydrogenase